MEPATKADLKEFFAEIRGELKQSIKQSIAKAFSTWKPAVGLLQQHVYHDKGNGAEDASVADPIDPLALKANTTLPMTTGFEPSIPTAAVTPTPTTAVTPVPHDTATPTIVERGPEVVLPASTGFVTTAPTTCSMECLRCDTTESRYATAPTTAPAVHTPTVDIDPVLVAPAASDGTIDDNGVASTPTTCSMVCLPRHPVAAPVQVAFSPPSPNEYVLDTNNIRVAVVPMATMGKFLAVLAPMVLAPTVQMQQLYKDLELFMSVSSQYITSKAPVHRPMPWPSFMYVHADGDEARPLPWPSFSEINDSEFPCDAIVKASRLCISDSSPAKPPGSIHGFYLWFTVRSFKLKQCSNGYAPISLLTISWEVKISPEYFFAREPVLGVPSIMDWHLLNFPCRSAVAVCFSYSQEHEHYFCHSQQKKSPILNSMRSDSSYDQLSCAIHDVSYSPGYSITRSRMNLLFTAAIRCSDWLASCVCDDPTTILLFAVLWDELVLQPWNSGHQDVSYAQFPCVNQDASGWPGYFFTGVLIHKQHSKLLYALNSPFVVLYDEWVLPLWDPGPEVFLSDLNKISWSQAIHDILLKKLMVQSLYFEHTLLAPHTSRPAAQDIRTKFPICESSGKSCCCGILSLDWHMTIILTEGGSMFPATVVLPVAKFCGNWQRAYSAVGRGAMLLIRSAALKYMELWWFATVLDTKNMGILSDGFSIQEDVTCSVQPTTMLTRAYQHSNFGWERLVWIAHSVFPLE